MGNYKSRCCKKKLIHSAKENKNKENPFEEGKYNIWYCSKCGKEYEQEGFRLYAK